MRCSKVRVLFSPLHNGELSLAARKEIQEHLESCDSCRKGHIEFLELMDILQGVDLPPLPDEFASGLGEKLRAQEAWVDEMLAPPVPAVRSVRRWALGPGLMAVGAAAAVVLLWLFGVFEERTSGVSPADRSQVGQSIARKTAPSPKMPKIVLELGKIEIDRVAVLTVTVWADAEMEDVEFSVTMPEGLAVVGDGREVFPEKVLSWRGRLRPGDNPIRIPVKALRAGRFVLSARARRADFNVETRGFVVVPDRGVASSGTSVSKKAATLLAVSRVKEEV
ncbi:MAG: zf-HC2 domain-containing protein [Deltaproteobacteria bacterium]|nr:zf-HC2 domain-containing protein [Deltaproteobacteria bacterium]